LNFPSPILKGRLLKRYKRFLADIELTGKVVTAHCANPGSMMGVKTEGATVWVTRADNPKRKLPYDWQVIEVGTARVCINTASANRIVEETVLAGGLPELSGYETLKREVKYGRNSRIDFLLSGARRPDCYVEVKNVTLSRETGLAEFPDSPTVRGAKHLVELADVVREGYRAVMLYIINRTDCERFTLAADIDPDYAAKFAGASQAGVESLAYGTGISESGIGLVSKLSIQQGHQPP